MKFTLGVLCRRGHDHEGTGQSLRYNSTGQCVECLRIWKSQYGTAEYQRKKEYYQRKSREYHAANRDKVLLNMAIYRKTPRFQESRDKSSIKCKAQRMARTAAWKQTHRGRTICRIHDRRRRAYEADAQRVPYQAEDIARLFEDFNGMCAYCGNVAHSVDHFVPISRGGADALDNFLPCCKPCNSSKSNRYGPSWYFSRTFFSRERWERISSVILNERQRALAPG